VSGKRRLNVVAQEDTLTGLGPAAFEQLARSCAVNDSDHRGVIATAAALTARCLSTCLPPSAQGELAAGLHTARLWTLGQASVTDAKSARATCFQAVHAIEDLTVQAVNRAKAHLPPAPKTPLDPHADHVVERYARLSAHFTTSAICHLLDAIASPETATQIMQDIEGARAYQAAGLGAARNPAFRSAAFEQATWETARPGQKESANTTAQIAVQVFHEYLGGRWRKHADMEREQNQRFVTWALSGRPKN